jgi:hypothetical protein
VDAGGLRLGIDFGTSNTVAVARWPDGRVRPLLFDGAPLLPSAVVLDEHGTLTAGTEALHSARVRPEFFDPNPKRRIDDGIVLLGEYEVPVRDLVGAVLRRVAEEADRVLAARPEVVLTHPAAWGARRCQVLRDAASWAGLAEPALVAEPVAAGTYFVRVHGARLPPGAVAVIYDLGAGTFDASVLRRTHTGFDVLACDGLPDAGGLDIDAALIAFLGAVYGSRSGALWQRLERPVTTADRRARRLLWDDVRGAKEALSRTSSSTVLIPLLDEDAPIGREQLEQLARPILDRTVAATANALREAGVRPGELACVFLVGGASRLPLAATLLHTAFGVAPTVIEQPEVVVAEGSLHASPEMWRRDPALDATPAPFWTGSVPAAPVSPVVGTAAVLGAAPVLGAPMAGVAPAVGTAPVMPPVSSPPMPVSPVPVSPPTAPPMSVPPVSGPPISGPPISGPPVSGPPISGPPVSGPPMLVPEPAEAPPDQSPTPQARPPEPSPAPSGVPYKSILAGVGFLVAALWMLAVDGGPEAFGLGLRTVFRFPATMVMIGQILLVAGLAVRGQLVAAEHEPFASAVRFVALLAVGHGIGMGIGLSQYDGDLQEAELTVATIGGIGLAIGGVGMIVGVLIGRSSAPGGWHRFGLPLMLGLGSGMALLWTQVDPYNEMFYTVFNSSDEPGKDLGRYLGFIAGVLALVVVATVIAALVSRRPAVRAARPAAWRTVNVAAAAALFVGGVGTAIIAASF